MIKPTVTAIMPVWSGAEFIDETIRSIQLQTFTNWEMLVIGEPDGDRIIKETVLHYENDDKRINWVENEIHLGLAASLNKGIEIANGKYIARVDADDPSHPTRFEKQVRFLDKHPEVAVLGSQYRNVYPNHAADTNLPIQPQNIKTSLLFDCCIGHPTIMFRLDLFIENHWRYPENCPAEDYTLWLSLLNKVRFANLDEVLIDHRAGFQTNISYAKRDYLTSATRSCIAEALQVNLGIDVSKYEPNSFWLLSDNNPLNSVRHISALRCWISYCIHLLFEIEQANGIKKVFDEKALARTLRKRWNRLLDACFVPDTPGYRRLIPHLPEKSGGSFSSDIICAFDKIGVTIKEKSAIGDTISIACPILYNCVDGGLKLLSGIEKSLPRAVVFGTGYYCHRFFEDMQKPLFELVCFCDNNVSSEEKTLIGKPCVVPSELVNIDYDYILIATRDYYAEIYVQLEKLGTPSDRILPLDIFRLVDSDLYLSMKE